MEYDNFPTPANIFGITSYLIWIVLQVLITLPVAAQTRVYLQPFAQQVRQVETSLAYLGQPLAQNDADAINQAIGNANEAGAIERLEQILDKYTLLISTRWRLWTSMPRAASKRSRVPLSQNWWKPGRAFFS